MTSAEPPQLDIVIPVYNEGGNILRTLGALTGLALDRVRLFEAEHRARLELERANELKASFVALAAHELRTPMTTIHGFVTTLHNLGDRLDEDQERRLREGLIQQTKRMALLIEQLLDLSRLDAGRVSVERLRVDLAPVAAAVAAEFQARARQEEHELELAAAGVEALGDEQRVGQICRILVDNALVHTPPGTTVRVQALRQGGTAVLAVEDDGPGIPEDGVRQVFERFYRLGGSVASGSGLGLAIARELAELMGGRIELDSRPGRTRFSLVLSAAPPTDELPVSTGKEPSRVQA